MTDDPFLPKPPAVTSGGIDYELLLQDSLRFLIRSTLDGISENDNFLPGEHHFYIGFNTRAPGVVMSERLRAQHPLQMIIVLQHQFDELTVTDKRFTVALYFGGVKEHLVIPFDAVFRFEDPSVNFALQFGAGGAMVEDSFSDADLEDELSDLELELSGEGGGSAAPAAPERGSAEPNVVSLDAFRNKK